MDMLTAYCHRGQSDSACLDNMVELLTLVRPFAAACDDDADTGSLGWQRPDGPGEKSLLRISCFLYGALGWPGFYFLYRWKIIGATLDRNGLRPSRYCVTTDDRVIMASETGALPIDPKLIKETGRLQPGKMFVVDIEQGRIISDEELKQTICSQKPYANG
jgi:glutamate synthase (NADPH/NADH) large chain